MSQSSKTKTVVVVGGGYAGSSVAQALSEDFDVVLIEPRDRFVHNVALLRALVEPSFVDRIVFSYDGLMKKGRVVHDHAALVEPGKVTLRSGTTVPADFIVLATGSEYPFPAKANFASTAEFFEQLAATRSALQRAARPLLFGAGPVGIELAGEITAAWPEKQVTIIDPAETIISGPYDENLRRSLHEQLADRGISLIIGDSMDLPSHPPGHYGEISAVTRSGRHVEADIWFRCFGGAPATGYLSDDLRHLKTGNGHLRVMPTLQLEGVEAIFAVGDVTDLPETKRAGVARLHAAVVMQNIRSLASGEGPTACYTPAPERMVIPLGPNGGAGYDARDGGRILGPEEVTADKGSDLKTDGVARQFNMATQSRRSAQ